MKFTEKEIQQIIREEYRAVRLEQLAKKKTIIEDEEMDIINKMLSTIEQFGNDPEVIDALGTAGLSGAIKAIKDKILSNQDPGSDSEGLDSVMEKKENCFAKGKYKTFKGKAKCIQRTKGLNKKSADAYVAKVLRDMGEIE